MNRKVYILALAYSAAVLISLPASAGEPSTSLLISRAEVTLPPYEKASGIESYTDRESYEEARADTGFLLEELRYRSDGLEVVAYLYQARDREPGPAPTVIYNRGGWVVPAHPFTLLTSFRRLADAGFVVIAPYLRGSAGAEGHDELGGADLGDIEAAIYLGQELGLVDRDQIYMYGESRGGMMTYLALREGFPLRAAAVFGALTDLEQLYREKRELYEPLMKVIWPDVESRRQEIAERRSAMAWPDALTQKPLLIMHGGSDRSVAVHHALDLAQELFAGGAEVELWIAAGEGHLIAGRSEERDLRAIQWFLSHSPGETAASPEGR